MIPYFRAGRAHGSRPIITVFFQQRLPIDLVASSHKSDSYVYAFKVLLQHESACPRAPPSQLRLEQIDAQ